MMLRKQGWNALLAGVLVTAPMVTSAQGATASAQQVTVALGRAQAIKYEYLGHATRIGFRGTVLLPHAQGKAKVQSHEGGATIRAVFEHLEPAARFGPEYMTYVLWAISPAGRATNLGEVVTKASGKARITATTNLQTFGLIVTAEPHFAVTSISDLVVLENLLTSDTRGKVEVVEADYPLLPRGTYLLKANPADLAAPPVNRKVSPYVHQARNAMRIARAAQAERFAPVELANAEAVYVRLEAEKRLWKKPAVALARQTVQLAEDARLVAVKLERESRVAEERQRAETARLQAEAAQEQAEAARLQASQEAMRATQAALQAKQQAVQQAAEQASRAAKQEVRAKLSRQLGKLLQTQDTEKGLLVRMSNVLFPSGKAELLPSGREKIAKVAGILMAHPGLKLKVEGHADSQGRPEFNAKLSERRAANVRDFLIKQGLSPQAITAEGLGISRPLTSNDTPTGRQQNRRVELLVSGEPIGI